MIDEIVKIFREHDYRWKVGGELIEPTADDIEKTLVKMRRVLKDSVNTQVDVGRLFMRQEGNDFSVYIHLGDYND